MTEYPIAKYQSVHNCYYLKDTSVNINKNINGIGNEQDQKNIVEAKLKQFFPICTNSEADAGYNKLGYPKYIVTFKNYNGVVLKTEQVEYGSSATPPEEPKREMSSINMIIYKFARLGYGLYKCRIKSSSDSTIRRFFSKLAMDI